MERILKINTYSLKLPYIVPLSLKQKPNKIKHNSEWKQKQMFMGNSLESLVDEQKGKGGKSPGVGQRDMEQKCEI